MPYSVITRIGLIGAGRMGKGIGRNLIRQGFALDVFDPDPAAVSQMVDLGGNATGSPAEAANRAQMVITCLPDVSAVEATYLDEQGLLATVQPGTTLVEMTSSSAALTRSIGKAAEARGLSLVDAPIMKGVQEAWDGTVHILLGGAESDRSRVRPILEKISARVIEVGELGNAHALKAINNAVSMSNAVIIAEAFQTARKLDVPVQQLIEILQSGLGGSRMLDLYAPRFLSGEHPRTGSIAFGEKDLGLFLDMARGVHALTPVAEAAHLVYRIMCGLGAEKEAPSRLADLMAEFSQRGSQPAGKA